MKRYLASLLSLFMMLTLFGCGVRNMDYIIENEQSISGTVEEITDGYFIMYCEDVYGYPDGTRCQVSLNPENKDSYTDVKIGDEVVVYHNGDIAESDPLQISTVYAITLRTPAGREPSVDLEKPYFECITGTITDIFTEGVGVDEAHVIETDTESRGVMYFTIVGDTEFFRYFADTDETVAVTKDDLYIGATAEIECESYHSSGYHPIFTVTLIENMDASRREKTVEVMKNTVMGIGRGTLKKAVRLSDADADVINKIIEHGNWNVGETDCTSDCAVNLGGKLVYYHSECGTFNEYDFSDISALSSQTREVASQSMTLTAEQRSDVNEILEKYISLGLNTVEP